MQKITYVRLHFLLHQKVMGWLQSPRTRKRDAGKVLLPCHNTGQSESAAAVTFSDHSFGLIPSTGLAYQTSLHLNKLQSCERLQVFSTGGSFHLVF